MGLPEAEGSEMLICWFEVVLLLWLNLLISPPSPFVPEIVAKFCSALKYFVEKDFFFFFLRRILDTCDKSHAGNGT